MIKPKHTHLLSDPNINAWYKNNERGSKVTADVYLRRLGHYCDNYKTTPKALICLTKSELQRALENLVTDMEDAGYTGSYTESKIKTLKSWLRYNDKRVDFNIKIRNTTATPTLENQKNPTLEDLHNILFKSTSLAATTAIIFMAHSGVRPSTLGNQDGTDGLQLRDIPDLIVHPKKKEIEFGRIPAIVMVRRDISKASNRYITFLSPQGCDILKHYLETRMQRKQNPEQLNKNSPIIAPGRWGKREFVLAVKIGEKIKRAFIKSDFKSRPYSLRNFFATQLLLANSKGKIIQDYRQFWMGHRGSMTRKYATDTNELSQDIIEDMRQSYSRCLPFLETKEAFRDSESEKIMIGKIAILSSLGYTEKEMHEKGILDLDPSDFKDVVAERMNKMLDDFRPEIIRKVIPKSEWEEYYLAGWKKSEEVGDKIYIEK